MISVLLDKTGRIQGDMAVAAPLLERRQLGKEHRQEFWDEVWQDGMELSGIPWYIHQHGSLLNTTCKGSTKFTISYWLLNLTSKANSWEQKVTALYSRSFCELFRRKPVHCSVSCLISKQKTEFSGVQEPLLGTNEQRTNIFHKIYFFFCVYACCACVYVLYMCADVHRG